MGNRDGASSPYEEARKQRLEENKRRMEELGLSSLSRNLSTKFSSYSPALKVRRIKPTIPAELLEKRRSTRIALKPAAVFRDMDVDFPRLRRSLSRGVNIRRRCISGHAIEEAAHVAENVKTSYPSFVKRMLPSHVSSCFWLGLPALFCKTHLPRNDEFIYLVDEQSTEWQSLYLAQRTGLSAGWKRFAEDHELEDGDMLVFELVAHNRFNIQIIRAANYESRSSSNREKKLKTA
eukprot:c4574_g1_i1 orf=143-847(-)